ncbi:J domain-containing protein [Sphingomonas mesophila]|uniref:J domain-containing protein n=1 Tax=Sphingomonas mesophila TaxID=2303576 RepID=UPI000E56F4A4|nr:J domain-containing protein [Sphingomonas mesophila]
MIDHYRTLGVAATADEAIIRAVYVALMKRVHPDRNSSPEMLREAQAINEAYAVLSDPKRRADYDEERARLQPWDRSTVLAAPPRRIGLSGVLVSLTALGGAIALAWWWPQLSPAQRGDVPLPMASTPARCAALSDPERVREALIVRLDQSGALDRAAAGALTAARFDLGPATDARDLAAPGEVACIAPLRITLPAAFRTASGDGTILSELQFSVSRTAPQSGVEVDPDARLIAALGAIRHQAALPAVVNPMLEQDVAAAETPPPAPVLAPPPNVRTATAPVQRPAPKVSPPPQRSVERRPPPAQTLAPALARTARSGEGLGGVDRHTMGFYEQSLRNAAGEKRGRLMRSHTAFASRLAACGSDQCRREAYLKRNVEISKIMIGQ